jgi:hypothetical protein
MPPKLKIVSGNPKVTWDPATQYTVWYCPEFPLDRLRYRDLSKLDPIGDTWRFPLRDDIKARGMRVPLLVWNHQSADPTLRMIFNKPYHLRVGRNRMWAIKDLGWTHAPAIVTGSCEFPCEQILTEEQLGAYWPDGHISVEPQGINVYNKTNPTNFVYPE